MARLRYNGLSTTLGAALDGTATAVTFGAALTHSGGTAVPTIVAPDYIPLAILTTGGAVSEIVYLTAYTSGATTGTITRAQEGTAGAVHASGDTVVHGPTKGDLPSGEGSAPATPIEGQMWYDPNATAPAAAAVDVTVSNAAFTKIVGTNAQAAFDSIDDQLAAGTGSSLTIQDENANVATAVTQIDFQGAGVTTTAGTGEVIVTIPGGGSSVTAATGTVATTETTASTTVADLTTAGPSATVTVGASGKVLVSISALMWNSTAQTGSNAWIDVSGANTIAAASPYVVSGYGGSTSIGPTFSGTFLFTGLAAGSTTFKMRYSVAAGTGSFSRRVITATAI